jgi:hypothetical protein
MNRPIIEFGDDMSDFTAPKVFRANPGKFKRRAFGVAAVVGAGSLTWACVSKSQHGYLGFAIGLVLLIFSFRFWNMMVRNGPWELTFNSEGVTMANKKKRESISWGDLESIRYMVWRGGHCWEFKSRTQTFTVDYYLDGLTGAQRKELEETIKGINVPNCKVVPFYDPLGLLSKAA